MESRCRCVAAEDHATQEDSAQYRDEVSDIHRHDGHHTTRESVLSSCYHGS